MPYFAGEALEDYEGRIHIRQESFIGNLLCIEARKINGLCRKWECLWSADSVIGEWGKNGDMIKVYKLVPCTRYSGVHSDYVLWAARSQEWRKVQEWFPYNLMGAICRKIWLNELAMFMNWFKGDMKFVGVRPLSQHYFDLTGRMYRREE